jgi:tetratricopeptide (TPR) repeat protein
MPLGNIEGCEHGPEGLFVPARLHVERRVEVKRGRIGLSLDKLRGYQRPLILLCLILSAAVCIRRVSLSFQVNILMKEVSARMLASTSFAGSTLEVPDIWARNMTDGLRSVRNATQPSINALVAQGSFRRINVNTFCRLNSWLDLEVGGKQEYERWCGDTADAYRGTWLWAQGKQDEAIHYWRRTGIANVMLQRANQLVWRNRSAAFTWAELSRKVDRSGSACSMLVWLYGIDGRWEDSLEAYRCASVYESVDARVARVVAGTILYGSGDLRLALKTFDIMALGFGGDTPAGLHQDVATALVQYEADAIGGTRLTLLNSGAWCMTQYSGFVLGWKTTDSAQLSSLYLLLGNAFEQVGDLPRAIDWYQRLLQLAPADCASHSFGGHAQALIGDAQMAAQERSILIQLCPNESLQW